MRRGTQPFLLAVALAVFISGAGSAFADGTARGLTSQALADLQNLANQNANPPIGTHLTDAVNACNVAMGQFTDADHVKTDGAFDSLRQAIDAATAAAKNALQAGNAALASSLKTDAANLAQAARRLLTVLTADAQAYLLVDQASVQRRTSDFQTSAGALAAGDGFMAQQDPAFNRYNLVWDKYNVATNQYKAGWDSALDATHVALALVSFTEGPNPFGPEPNSTKRTTTLTANYTSWDPPQPSQVQTTWTILSAGGRTVRTITDNRVIAAAAGFVNTSATLTWDGRDSGGLAAPDGSYTYQLTGSLLPQLLGADPLVGNNGVNYVQGAPIRLDTTPPALAYTNAPRWTNNASITITGTWNDDTGVDLSTAIATVNGSAVNAQFTAGGFSYALNNVSDGDYYVVFAVRDNAGNPASLATTVGVDTTPPIPGFPNPPDGTYTNAPTPTFSLALADDRSGINWPSVSLTVNGMDVTAQTTHDEASITYAPLAALADGVYAIVVSAADNAGNAMIPVSWTVTVDTTPPSVTLQVPQFTNQVQPVLSGTWSDDTAVDLTSVEILLDGNDVTDAGQPNQAGFSLSPPNNLGEGNHTLVVNLCDLAHNFASVQTSFLVDSTPPVWQNVSPADGLETMQTQVAFSGVPLDSGSGVDSNSIHLWLDGQEVSGSATIGANGVQFTPAANLSIGPHIYQADVADLAGNSAPTLFVSFVIVPPSTAPIRLVIPQTIPKNGTVVLGVELSQDIQNRIQNAASSAFELKLSDAGGLINITQYGGDQVYTDVDGTPFQMAYIVDAVSAGSVTITGQLTLQEAGGSTIIQSEPATTNVLDPTLVAPSQVAQGATWQVSIQLGFNAVSVSSGTLNLLDSKGGMLSGTAIPQTAWLTDPKYGLVATVTGVAPSNYLGGATFVATVTGTFKDSTGTLTTSTTTGAAPTSIVASTVQILFGATSPLIVTQGQQAQVAFGIAGLSSLTGVTVTEAVNIAPGYDSGPISIDPSTLALDANGIYQGVVSFSVPDGAYPAFGSWNLTVAVKGANAAAGTLTLAVLPPPSMGNIASIKAGPVNAGAPFSFSVSIQNLSGISNIGMNWTLTLANGYMISGAVDPSTILPQPDGSVSAVVTSTIPASAVPTNTSGILKVVAFGSNGITGVSLGVAYTAFPVNAQTSTPPPSPFTVAVLFQSPNPLAITLDTTVSVPVSLQGVSALSMGMLSLQINISNGNIIAAQTVDTSGLVQQKDGSFTGTISFSVPSAQATGSTLAKVVLNVLDPKMPGQIDGQGVLDVTYNTAPSNASVIFQSSQPAAVTAGAQTTISAVIQGPSSPVGLSLNAYVTLPTGQFPASATPLTQPIAGGAMLTSVSVTIPASAVTSPTRGVLTLEVDANGPIGTGSLALAVSPAVGTPPPPPLLGAVSFSVAQPLMVPFATNVSVTVSVSGVNPFSGGLTFDQYVSFPGYTGPTTPVAGSSFIQRIDGSYATIITFAVPTAVPPGTFGSVVFQAKNGSTLVGQGALVISVPPDPPPVKVTAMPGSTLWAEGAPMPLTVQLTGTTQAAIDTLVCAILNSSGNSLAVVSFPPTGLGGSNTSLTGAFSFQVPSIPPQPAGSQQIMQVVVRLLTGQQFSTSSPIQVVVPPSTWTGVQPSNGTLTVNRRLPFVGTLSNLAAMNLSTLHVTLDGVDLGAQVVVSPGGSVQATPLTDLVDGSHQYVVNISNASGAAQPTLSLAFQVVSALGTITSSGGGTVTVAEPGNPVNGVSVAAPPGAVATPTTVTISVPAPGTIPAFLAGTTPIGRVSLVQASQEPFLAQVALTLPYDPRALGNQGTQGIVPMQSDPTTGTWQVAPNFTVDPVHSVVTVRTTTLSYWNVFLFPVYPQTSSVQAAGNPWWPGDPVATLPNLTLQVNDDTYQGVAYPQQPDAFVTVTFYWPPDPLGQYSGPTLSLSMQGLGVLQSTVWDQSNTGSLFYEFRTGLFAPTRPGQSTIVATVSAHSRIPPYTQYTWRLPQEAIVTYLPGPPSKLAIQGLPAPPNMVVAGQPYQFTATPEDRFGNVLSNFSGTLENWTPDATVNNLGLYGVMPFPAGGGTYTAVFKSSYYGVGFPPPLLSGFGLHNIVVQAGSGNLGAVGAAPVDVVGLNPASISSIVKIGGDNQQGMVSTQLPIALQAQVRDSSGAPVPGASVTVSLLSDNGSRLVPTLGASPTAGPIVHIANANGVVQTYLILGRAGGYYQVQMQVDTNGPSLVPPFTETALAGPPPSAPTIINPPGPPPDPPANSPPVHWRFNSFPFLGTGIAGATLTLLEGANTIGQTTVGANGTWSIQSVPSSGAFPDGQHTVVAKQQLPFGQPSGPSQGVTFFILTTPPAPIQATATAGDGFIDLAWQPSNDPYVLGYLIYRKGPNDLDFVLINPPDPNNQNRQLPITNTSFRDNNNGQGLQNNQQYCYKVLATDDAQPAQ